MAEFSATKKVTGESLFNKELQSQFRYLSSYLTKVLKPLLEACKVRSKEIEAEENEENIDFREKDVYETTIFYTQQILDELYFGWLAQKLEDGDKVN